MPLTAENCADGLFAVNAAMVDQASTIRLNIMEDTLAEDPWSSLFEGGTVAPHEGETIVTQLAGRPLLNKSFTQPQFTVKSQLCNTKGEVAAFGSEQYTALLEGDRGSSPYICIHTLFNKLDRELEQHKRNLGKTIREYMQADARNNVHVKSGFKYVATTALQPADRLTGEEYAVSTDYAGQLPNAGLTIREIVRVINEIQQSTTLTRFRSPDAGAVVRLIGSGELSENLRNEATNLAESKSLVEGGDQESVNGFKKYQWEWRYRQIQFGRDPRPLRFNEIDGDGFPVLITPYENKIGNVGEHAVVNSEWKSAAFEIAFLMWKNTFKRLVPENFMSEAGAKWPELAVTAMGQLIWSNVQDNDCNEYGDRGRFLWQIIRAWQADMPWACCPMMYKRCDPTDGLTACSSLSE